jgi:hypothetical protein
MDNGDLTVLFLPLRQMNKPPMKRMMARTTIAPTRIGAEIRLLSIAAKIVRFGSLITVHPSKRRGGKKSRFIL